MSKLKKLKAGIKNGTEVTLKLSSVFVGDYNDENNFPYNLLLANTQVSNLLKAFANNSLANIKLSKTQLHRIEQSGELLSRKSEDVSFQRAKDVPQRSYLTILKTSRSDIPGMSQYDALGTS